MSNRSRRWRTTAAVQQRARDLRKEQTPAEARLWQRLRGKQLNGLKFRRQHPVGPFILDFYCPSASLAIELDGDTHAEQEGYDEARTQWLEEQGYRVIRFTNREVCNQLLSVLEAIAEACEAPPPVPPVGRGGSQTSPPQGGGD